MKLSFLPSQRRTGFTLIELLLVIGIIAILAAIVIVAINPTKQLADARNAQRRSDVNTILNAVYQYAIDNNGNLPTGIPVEPTAALPICQTAVTGTDCTVDVPGVDLATALVGDYLVAIPVDPSEQGTESTNYTVVQDSTGRITVAAPGAEQSATISVRR